MVMKTSVEKILVNLTIKPFLQSRTLNGLTKKHLKIMIFNWEFNLDSGSLYNNHVV